MTTETFRHIRLVREGKKEYLPLPPTTSPADIAPFLCTKIGSETQESFMAVYLDSRYRPIGWSIVSRGTVGATIVHPRDVFSPAIHLMASAIVVGHNHPSSDLSPSQEDKETTRRLKTAGEILGIEVLDHLIVCDNSFLSFRKEGML